VLEGGLEAAPLERGRPAPAIPGYDAIAVEPVSAAALAPLLAAGDATVVDVATSLEYRAGHIPDAWWAIRSRLPQSLRRVAGSGPLVFTSPDGVLARLAAGDAQNLTDRSVRYLAGGTAAWREHGGALSQGFEHMADENNDVQYKAYDHTENIEFHMQEYLSWEVGLVEQVARDGTARFRHFSA
jgi:rhodanese-related sulfurtransferase